MTLAASVNDEEEQYINLIKSILAKGEERIDRTGTGTLSIFAPPQLIFNLAHFPLLTTKKMGLRIIFEELMWFVRGYTDAKLLAAKNVHIWDKNGSKEALENLGLPYEQGDLGPVYGFQWRHFGAEYLDCHTDYSGQGVDQLKQVIEKILFNPMDRRIILTAWNPLGIRDITGSYSKDGIAALPYDGSVLCVY
jgi:thymidylate synthase